MKISKLFLSSLVMTFSFEGAFAQTSANPVKRKPAQTQTTLQKPAPAARPRPAAPVVPVQTPPPVAAATESAAVAAENAAIAPASLASYWEPGFRLILFQETVQATRNGSEGLLTQSQGSSFGLKWKIPFRNIRWVQSHALEFALGTIRAKGQTTNIPDQIISPFYMLTFNPGVIYRTAPPSDFGLSFPISYRVINWPKDDPTLTLERGASIGYGVQFNYVNHISALTSLTIAFTNQISWQATIWSVGLDHAFR